MPNLQNINPITFLTQSLSTLQTIGSGIAKNLSNYGVRGALNTNIPSIETDSGTIAGKENVYLNPNTTRNLQAANGDQAYWQVMQQTYSDFMQNFGTKGNIQSLDVMCQSVCDEILKLNTDMSPTQKNSMIQELSEKLTQFSTIQKSITDARVAIDLRKAALVKTEIPGLLKTLTDLNYPNPSAEDIAKLNLAQFDLSQKIGTLTFEEGRTPEGGYFTVKVGSVKLLEKSTVFPMNYASTPNPQPGIALNPVTIPPGINPPGSAIAIDSQFSTGEIADLNMADKQLLSIQAGLDNFAIHLRESINKLHNQGTGTQPPSSLQGTTGYYGTEGTPINVNDVISGTGTLRIALLDRSQNNMVVDYVDVALQQGESISSLFTRINAGTYALNSGQTFNISVNFGVPQIACSPANSNTNLGISIGHNGQALAMMSAGGAFNAAASTNFSHFFHLNDLITSNVTGTNGVFGNLQVRSDVPGNVNRLSGCDLDSSAALTNQMYGVVDRPPGARNIFDQIYQSFRSSQFFNASGDMGNIQTTLLNYGALITNTYASKKTSADDELKSTTVHLQSLQQVFQKESGIDDEEQKLKGLLNSRSQEAVMSMMRTFLRLEQDTLKLLEL